MKTIGLLIILVCKGQFLKAQEQQAKDFYEYLVKSIEKADTNSILIKTINYGCLGSKTNWNAKISINGDLLTINFYSERFKDVKNLQLGFKTVLDTTFNVKGYVLKHSLEVEINEIKTRPIFLEGSYKISIYQGDYIKEFRFKRGDGLYSLLRLNKPLPKYLARK